ncbi:unnamed protein product [Prunus armeniaca]|uniref:Uncharacterized protein n=1 Tax=Prunus armeniaca TaxID=36596 RepID=A0A6J5XJF9_PRUAR|nr:unnamed protein product [Prunus armeniaca]
MISLNWITTRLGSLSWELDLALPGRGVDVAFPRIEVFGVPCAGSVIFMINFAKFPQTAPTVGAGFLSRRNTSTCS